MAKAPKSASTCTHKVLNPCTSSQDCLPTPHQGALTQQSCDCGGQECRYRWRNWGLRRDQHVTGQAMSSLYFLEEVLLANPY